AVDRRCGIRVDSGVRSELRLLRDPRDAGIADTITRCSASGTANSAAARLRWRGSARHRSPALHIGPGDHGQPNRWQRLRVGRQCQRREVRTMTTPNHAEDTRAIVLRGRTPRRKHSVDRIPLWLKVVAALIAIYLILPTLIVIPMSFSSGITFQFPPEE